MKDVKPAIFDIALTMIPGVGPKMIRILIPYFGSAENIFRQPKARLLRVPGIGPMIADKISDKQVLILAEEEIRKAAERGVEILSICDPKYPERLADCIDAPTLLYYSGQEILNHPRTIAIVGSRNATEYGKELVEKLVSEWAAYDVMIVSGLAYGIDISAHLAALKHGVPTLGVLGSGLGWIYPAMHKKTVAEMKKTGGILSEFHFMAQPDAQNFPQRNRIVAGMSHVIVVVEAAEKGGALITAEIANSYNKEIMAVPGRIGDPYSKGCLKLIRDHKAHILTEAVDLVKLMGWEEDNQPKQLKIFPDLSEEEQRIVSLLQNEGELSIDALSIKSDYKLNKLSALMLGLELKDVIKPIPGKRYKISSF